MDPVTAAGLAGSIISILQLTGKVLSLTSKYIGGVRSAPREIEQLQKALQDFNQVLENLGDHVKGDPKLKSLTDLNREGGPIKQCSKDLEELRLKLDQPTRLKNFKWPLKATEVSQFIDRMEAQKTLFLLALGSDHLHLAQETHRMVQSETAAQARWREDKAARIQYQKTLQEGGGQLWWLYSEPTDTKHFEISHRRQEGTGNWFLRSPQFREFMKEKQDASLLWAHGIPGAGKTFISSLVIDHLRDLALGSKWGIAYIYCDYKDQEQQGPYLFLASLIKQLVCQSTQPPPHIEELRKRANKEDRKPTFDELYNALVMALGSFSRAFLVFDALDECTPNDQRKLLPLFENMRKDGYNIFMTSRPFSSDIKMSLENAAKIEILANEDDIRLYIEKTLNAHPQAKSHFKKAQCSDIAADLMACTQGMFLLILAKLEELKNSTAKQKPLDTIYERAMNNINAQVESRKNLALRVLSWLMKAKRTLTFDELRVAVAVEHERYELEEINLSDKETLVDVCSSLVMIDENSGTVRFVHYTAQEYLMRDGTLLEFAGFNVAMACITYLSFDDFSSVCTSDEAYKSRKELNYFFEYAARHLLVHVKDCDESLSTSMVLKFLERAGSINSFQQARQKWGTWRGIGYNDYTKGRTAIHLACSMGHSAAVQKLFDKDANIFATDSKGRTPLHQAAKRGHEMVVRLLIEKEALENGMLRNIARKGRLAIVQLLVGGRVVGNNILDRGTKRMCLATGSLIFGGGGYISTKDAGGRVAVAYAAIKGHEAVVRLLLERGADVSARRDDGQTPLHYAAERGHEAVVRLLLERGADVSARRDNGRTPLYYAEERGHEAVVRLLLEQGANTLIRDKNRKTAMRLRSHRNKKEIAELFKAAKKQAHRNST